MSRYAPKHRPRRDSGETQIVEALRKAGCLVWRKLPVDLLVRLPTDKPGVFRCIEAKALSARRRKDQPVQDAFIDNTGTPRVRTPEDALRALGVIL